jgi:Spy/CpxP family protein refolding chaperone
MRSTKLTVLLLAMAGSLFAQQGGHRGARTMMADGGAQLGNAEALKEYLKLTPQQVTDLQAVRSSMREAVRPLVQGLEPKVKALRQELRKDPVDSEAVSRLRKELDEARSAIRAKRDEFGAKARAVLTPDQVSSLQALDQALKLQRAAHQAAQLGLIERPERADRSMLRSGRKK